MKDLETTRECKDLLAEANRQMTLGAALFVKAKKNLEKTIVKLEEMEKENDAQGTTK